MPVSFATNGAFYEVCPETHLRREAYRSFVEGLDPYKNLLAATLSTEVRKNVVMVRLRGYKSAQHMLLRPDRVSPETFNLLIDTLGSALSGHMRRYARMKQRVLGLDAMTYADLRAPLQPGFDVPVSFNDAFAAIEQAVTRFLVT